VIFANRVDMWPLTVWHCSYSMRLDNCALLYRNFARCFGEAPQRPTSVRGSNVSLSYQLPSLQPPNRSCAGRDRIANAQYSTARAVGQAEAAASSRIELLVLRKLRRQARGRIGGEVCCASVSEAWLALKRVSPSVEVGSLEKHGTLKPHHCARRAIHHLNSCGFGMAAELEPETAWT
jgi:hypothetical protein